MDEKNDFPVEIAEKIVQMLHQVTNKNVNFMGQGGVIIATMQPQRLGQVHEGARRIMSGEINELAISVEEAQNLEGTLPGYNGVVMYSGKRLGCIGLTGDPIQMRPLQQLATIIVREEYQKYRTDKRKQEIIENVVNKVSEISTTMQQISSGSEDVLQHSQKIEGMTNHAEESIKNVNQVVKTVKQIADETMLLGVNASIEAARAGKYGAGFGVVAQEIGKLSTDSNNSLKNINQILDEMKSSISKIAEKIRDNTAITQKQVQAIQGVSAGVLEIKEETGKLMESDT